MEIVGGYNGEKGPQSWGFKITVSESLLILCSLDCKVDMWE